MEKRYGLYTKKEEDNKWILNSIHPSIKKAQDEWYMVYVKSPVKLASWIRPYEGEITYPIETQDHNALWQADVRSMNKPWKGFTNE